uniref:Tensin 3 n=1 Tax=Esox lucius TaxID=8010 RepID=A0A6Q2WX40_ESOLU
MEEGYELDLTYVTERIIAVSFPRACTEEIYLHNLKDVTRMLKSKHADNYLIINLSEKRHDLSKMNPKTLDTGWPDLHAPPLDKICTICKAMEGWLNAEPLHVVVIHCRVSTIYFNWLNLSHSADQALDRFAMRKYYDDKVSAMMTPSQKRYVWILNSLLSGSMKINASPLFLHCIILHGIPNFNAAGVCRPYLKVYQGMQAVYSSGVYHIGPGHRDRICISLEPAQLLKGDIMVKCYHKSDVTSEREVIFRLQFHTGAIQGYNLMFEKEDMETANKDPRFPDYGKVELVFSEGPEKIPGAERWQNGADVIVDYNTADPLTRWDSYQNIIDGEGEPSHCNLCGVRSGFSNPLGPPPSPPPPRATPNFSPDHSDHALSASSDSGLSTPITGPSRQEKAQLKRLLSGFGLEEPSPDLEEMSESGSGGPGGVAIQRLVPTQAHVNGDRRPLRERETDILDDEVLLSSHDLRSVDSLGTLSSSCHKSSQNSLLSDGFGSPGGEELHHLPQLHHPAPVAMEEYERAYAETRRGCLGQRSASVSTPAGAVPVSKQQVYRQGSYSTHTWVRQQQMVAAHQYAYLPAEEERYPGAEKQQGGSLPEPPAATVSQQAPALSMDTSASRMALTRSAHSEQTPAVLTKNQRDEEFNSLTVDIDNSIDQLNQLIMDLDPTFVPVPMRSSSVKRTGGEHVNGSAATNATSTGCPNGVAHRLTDNGTHGLLFRSDCVDYRAQGPEIDSGVEAGNDITPPTPAFPISPPTPYGKSLLHHCVHTPIQSMSLDYGQQSPSIHAHPAPNAHSSPLGSQRSRVAHCALTHSPARSFDEPDDSGLGGYGPTDCPASASPLLGNGGMERGLLMASTTDGQGAIRNQLQAQVGLPPMLPEKRRASDGEQSMGTASPAPSGFSSPHSGSSLSIPFPNTLPDLSASAQMTRTASTLPDVLASKQVTVNFVQDTSKFWYKPDISRDQAIAVLKDKEPGCFIVRDSHSFRGAYGLAMKVATPPPSVLQQSKKGSLTALVCQHSITPLALPCKLIIPDRDPLEDVVETTTQSVTNSAAELLKQGAACNVWFLGSVEMESLTGCQAVQKATSKTLRLDPLPTSTVVHFKVSSQGITLTDNQRKLFFRRHYAVNTVIFCALDPQDRKWKKDGCTSAKIFGFVARKTSSGQDNVCHLFAEHDPEQPASAIVNFVSKVMIGSQKTK